MLETMRKPVFPRIILLVLLYCAFFVALVVIQFAKRGGFTQKTDNFVVAGQYRLPGENDPPRASNEYFLDGDTHVFFGGIDFGMIKGADGHSLRLTMKNGAKEEALPERMVMSPDAVLFSFPGGAELKFATQYAGGSLEMLISGNFSGNVTGLELPFKPLRKAGIRDAGDGQFIVNADGVNYSFGHSPMDSGRRLLLIKAGGAVVSYGAIPERKSLSPGDFILPQAKTAEAYNDVITKWRDQNFSLWNRTISGETNEDVVMAFADEALVRGTYKAAVAAVSPAFLTGTTRTYESSVYLGDLEQAYRSLGASEREKLARLSRQINEKNLDFLKEPRVFEYFAVRGHLNFFDAGADLVRAIDPSTIALDITPGILEGYVDWKTFRPTVDNPFERLVDQACFVILESLRKTANDLAAPGNRIFAFYGSQGDTEFNLRLGKALMVYTEAAPPAPGGQNSAWAGIGRSLVLSALSMGDAAGAVKAGLVASDAGAITESTARPGLTTARLYRILAPRDYYPRAITIGASVNSIWTWTAAQAVSASQENNVVDIAVNFPAGETHYMIIRGVRPFVKIQLYSMDFRTDPQFERYDSSGWSYVPQEQILILKMKHRTQTEHVKVFY
ncbi:MAG: hypothetical protein FWC45_04620 [Treponema sp.]|nr:hypothetical protein [Treponema sp.]